MLTLTTQSIESFQRDFPHWWFIRLLDAEAGKLEDLGKQRNRNGQRNGWNSKTKDLSDKWDIAGIAGEWAASLALNLPVGCITSKNASWLNQVGDVGGFIEVRTSTGNSLKSWDLGSFRNALKPERPYVHAISCLFPYWMVLTGWAWGDELLRATKIRKAAHHPEPIHWLEQGQLHPLMDLFDVIRKREEEGLQAYAPIGKKIFAPERSRFTDGRPYITDTSSYTVPSESFAPTPQRHGAIPRAQRTSRDKV